MAGAIALTLITLWWVSRPGDSIGGPGEAVGWRLPDDVTDGWQRTTPPIDLQAAARAARAIPGIPVTPDRHITAWRDRATGAEILFIALVYPTADEATRLMEGRAGELIAGRFGLQSGPETVEGADGATRWSGAGYRAVSFRVGRRVAFVGASQGGPNPVELAARMAATAAEMEERSGTPTASDLSGTPPTVAPTLARGP